MCSSLVSRIHSMLIAFIFCDFYLDLGDFRQGIICFERSIESCNVSISIQVQSFFKHMTDYAHKGFIQKNRHKAHKTFEEKKHIKGFDRRINKPVKGLICRKLSTWERIEFSKINLRACLLKKLFGMIYVFSTVENISIDCFFKLF